MSMPDQNPDPVPLPVRAAAWLRAFQPQPLAVDGRERWRATLGALVGAACAFAIPDQALAAATAVGLAITLMFALRCLHPLVQAFS